MIRTKTQNAAVAEPEAGRPAGTGEQWLGPNPSTKQRLWERLKPPSPKQIRLISKSVGALSARADEIRLKDGKKLYGVIVAYDDNMFKVKTDFGYVLVEKDKIASIIPAAPASPKKEAGAESSQPAKDSQPKPEPGAASSAEATATNASAKSAVPGAAEKREKAPPKIPAPALKPHLPTTAAPTTLPPPIKTPES